MVSEENIFSLEKSVILPHLFFLFPTGGIGPIVVHWSTKETTEALKSSREDTKYHLGGRRCNLNHKAILVVDEVFCGR